MNLLCIFRFKTLFFACLLFFKVGFAQNFHPDFWDGSVFFKIKSGVDGFQEWHSDQSKERLSGFPELAELIDHAGISSIEKAFKTPSLRNIYKIQFTNYNSADFLVRHLEAFSWVEYAHKNPIYRLFYVPNDIHANQWYFNLIGAFDAWSISKGSSDVKVAIVDDAIKISHPDLAPIIYVNPNEILDGLDTDGNGFIDDINGFDVADNDNDTEPPLSHWMYGLSSDVFTHGTHCAGIAGAATDNGIGVASIGFGVSIIPVKATKNNSLLPLALDAGPEGIDYAIAAGADIISLSWGSAQDVQAVRDVVNVALDAGIIVVAAAGNDGNTSLMYPASIDGVISVGAITHNDVIASFSQRNNKVSLMAPGDQIFSTVRENDGYKSLEGTSMAAPMVAGLAGLMKSFAPSLSADDIISCLLAGCDNIDSINPTAANLMGAGRINAHKALLCLQNINAINNISDNKIQFFPNPARDVLYVNIYNDKAYASVNIYDMLGKKVMDVSVLSGANNLEVDISSLVRGVYLLSLCSGSQCEINQKLIVY